MKIVLADGCFDPLHVGHIYHLRAARKFGDVLVVAVTRDEFVNKGWHRPAIPEADRLEAVRELRCVDLAFLVDDSFQALELVQPHVFAKGEEYQTNLAERDYCEERGIMTVFPKTPKFSSTELLRWYADREAAE